MVRKKLKKAPAHSLPVPSQSEEALFGTNLTTIFFAWVTSLRLLEDHDHDLFPEIPPDLNVFSLLVHPSATSSQPLNTAFAEVRGIQALRARVGSAHCAASANDLRLVYLVSLLIFIDPDTSSIKKAVKSLSEAAEAAVVARGDNVVGMVALVTTRFLERAWEQASTSAVLRDAVEAQRIVISLQLLGQVPAAKRLLVEGDGMVLFGRSIAVLDLMLGAEGPASRIWRASDVGKIDDDKGASLVGMSMRATRPMVAQKSESSNEVSSAELSSAMDFCGEVLKAAAYLMSMPTEWDIERVPGGNSTALRISELCILLLWIPSASRDTVTHASSALVHLATASWRAGRSWPVHVTSVHPEDSPDLVDVQLQAREVRDTKMAQAIQDLLLPQEADRSPRKASAMSMTTLLASCTPLPPGASLAVCRALLHIVHPRTLLVRLNRSASAEKNKADEGSLFHGAILRTILKYCGAGSRLQLRFFALQTLEAWCSRATIFAEGGFALGYQPSLQSTDNRSTENRSADDRREGDEYFANDVLSGAMDVAMAALVHPSRLVSSIAPVLLQRVINLRHVMYDGSMGSGTRDQREWEQLTGRVMRQSASFKGKYIALAVLMPRVGAIRLLGLYPSLMEQVVRAVGARGNVSGQATSFVVQLIKAVATQYSPAEESPRINLGASRSGGVPDNSCVGGAEKTSQKGSGGKAAFDPNAVLLGRKWWVGPAAAALTQDDLWSRGRVASYLLPEVFKLDPGSVADLLLHLRGQESGMKSTRSPFNYEGDRRDADGGRIWAMMEVARHARNCGTSAGGMVVSNGDSGGVDGASAGIPGALRLEEVRWAALHIDETLRMSALALLCTDVRVTTVPVAAEIDLLKEVLPYSLKVVGSQNRQLLLRSLQVSLSGDDSATAAAIRLVTFVVYAYAALPRQTVLKHMITAVKAMKVVTFETLLVRMRETVRACAKHLATSSAEGDSGGAAFATARGSRHGRYRGGLRQRGNGSFASARGEGSDDVGQLEPPSHTVDRVEEFVHWLCQEVLQSLYPGCPFEREVFGLEVAQLILTELLPEKDSTGLDGHTTALAKVVSSSIFCRQVVDTLLALLGSSWDRTRRLAYGILARFPRPLAGYEGREGVASLAAEGLRWSGSARQQDSDRGALILRLVSVSYAVGLGMDVPLLAIDSADRSTPTDVGNVDTTGTSKLAAEYAALPFLENLCSVLSHRLDGVQRLFETPRGQESVPDKMRPPVEATPLPHGVVLTIHYLLLDSAATKISSSGEGPKQEGAGDQRTGANAAAASIVRLQRRRAVMKKLLVQALRALRLSLQVVGEHHGAHDSSEEDGGRSVNANGHVGRVSIDGHGHITSSTVGAENASIVVARDTVTRDTVAAGNNAGLSNAADGQRIVVGAWLLTKEACRCLATVVKTSPLPLSAEEATASAGAGSFGASTPLIQAGEEGKEILSGRSASLLTEKDVTLIGETLLDSLLSLKHMGCVASAQAAFQVVCEALLHDKGKNASLQRLPSIWLGQLIHQLNGAEQEFVLRRSAGLALAFMAILKAEPRSVAPVLMPHGMRHLLALANPDQPPLPDSAAPPTNDAGYKERASPRSEWKGTVHALNVLKVVFVDATLADDVGPYVTQATIAAVRGFESAVWAVRNSSMMLFASLMQRAIGGAKNASPTNVCAAGAKRPHAAKAAVAAETFFEEHHKLHPFLLAHLERACAGTFNGQQGTAGVAATARAEMHPVLYPILLLLARLRSTGGEAETARTKEEHVTGAVSSLAVTADFISPVMRCARNPHFLARAASARALAALVPPERSPILIGELLEKLPKDVAQAEAEGAGGHNHIHGTLLQVLELLVAARVTRKGSGIPDTSKGVESEQDLRHGRPSTLMRTIIEKEGTITTLLWLADPALSPCPPIRYAMLRVLEALSSEVSSFRGVDGPIHIGLRTAEDTNFAMIVCPKPEDRVVPGRSLLTFAVVGAIVRRQWDDSLVTKGDASSRLGCTRGKQASCAERLQVVIDLMRSTDVDVRDAAIKTTKKYFGKAKNRVLGPSSQEPLTQLWDGAGKALEAEFHPPNKRRLVRLLCRVGVQLRRGCSPRHSRSLWNHLHGLCSDLATVGSEDIHAGAMEAMGIILSLDGDGMEGSSIAAHAGDYVTLLESAADPEQSVSTRAAAAASLASSPFIAAGSRRDASSCDGTMHLPDGGSVSTIMRLWFVVLALLQDDDEGVRASAATVCVTTPHSTIVETFVDQETPAPAGGGRVDLCSVTLVLSRLALLAEGQRDHGYAAEQFVLMLLRMFEKMFGLHGATSGGDEDEREMLQGHYEDFDAIFGHEERNQFQEPPLFVSVAAPYLCRVLIALDARGCEISGPVAAQLVSVLSEFTAILEDLIGTKQIVPGVTWLRDAYQRVVPSARVAEAILRYITTPYRQRSWPNGCRLSYEVARVVKACEAFNAAVSDGKSVHSDMTRSVGLALGAARP